MTLTPSERATILAALRFWKHNSIGPDDASPAAPTDAEIDTLIERIERETGG
jgi:hypothetical protein